MAIPVLNLKILLGKSNAIFNKLFQTNAEKLNCKNSLGTRCLLRWLIRLTVYAAIVSTTDKLFCASPNTCTAPP